MRSRAIRDRWGDKLAPYACAGATSRGRARQQEPSPQRNEFQSDRDRLLHSRFFLRLDGKSHAYLVGTGDRFRSRMGSAVTAAGVGRRLSRWLGLNGDLVEAICLARAVGLPPFGVAGEEALARIMIPHGGFSACAQSLRVATELELQYPDFNGLNLSWEILEGIAYADGAAVEEWAKFPHPSLEAQTARVAELLADVTGDIDDGLEAGLLVESELSRYELWANAGKAALKTYSRLDAERATAWTSRFLLDWLVADTVGNSDARITALNLQHPDEARKSEQSLIGLSEAVSRLLPPFREFVHKRLHLSHEMADLNRRSSQCLEQLFDCLSTHEHLIPSSFSRRIRKQGSHRVTCDYLAAMTDRFALHEHQKLIGGASALNATGLEQPALF